MARDPTGHSLGNWDGTGPSWCLWEQLKGTWNRLEQVLCHLECPPGGQFFGLYVFGIFFLAVLFGMWDLSFPNQGSNPCPLQWEHGVLTTGPPGKSLACTFYLSGGQVCHKPHTSTMSSFAVLPFSVVFR